MITWKKTPTGYISSYFAAPVFRKASFMQLASKVPEITRLRFRAEKTRYEKTWQLELLQGGEYSGNVVAHGFRTAGDAKHQGGELYITMGGTPWE